MRIWASPGISPSRNITPAAIRSGTLLLKSWRPNSTPTVSLVEVRVTTMPPATETSSDGIIVTRPSPTVRIV